MGSQGGAGRQGCGHPRSISSRSAARTRREAVPDWTGQGKTSHFLFYELFVDEAAFKAHQESAYFKTFIAGQALPLLAKRERTQYALL
jgi:quinol monooxygenase YgiN